MPLVFRTAPDDPRHVEIAGVGRLAGNGRGGIPVSRAAESRRMEEFLDPSTREPLSGSKLTAAAKAFADSRGLVVENVKEIDEEALVVEAGGFPRGPSIEELSAEASEVDRLAVGAAEHALNPNPELPDSDPPFVRRDLPVTSDEGTVAEPPTDPASENLASGEQAR